MAHNDLSADRVAQNQAWEASSQSTSERRRFRKGVVGEIYLGDKVTVYFTPPLAAVPPDDHGSDPRHAQPGRTIAGY